MGADLIGCFAKGPKSFAPEMICKAMEVADSRLAWLCQAREARDSDDMAALIAVLRDCPWSNPGALVEPSDPDEARYLISQLLGLAGPTDGLKGEHAVGQFVENWPLSLYRDAAHITDPSDPNVVIVFAGERTWGDPPSGHGFQMLMRAGALGIGEALGVWIQAAFISIPIHGG